MTDLRKYAKGKPCQIRIPGYMHNPETTVLCHFRQAGLTGGAQKAPDILGAHGCYDCHRITEGAQLTAEEKAMDRDQVKLIFLEGVMRTQYALVKEGVIKW